MERLIKGETVEPEKFYGAVLVAYLQATGPSVCPFPMKWDQWFVSCSHMCNKMPYVDCLKYSIRHTYWLKGATDACHFYHLISWIDTMVLCSFRTFLSLWVILSKIICGLSAGPRCPGHGQSCRSRLGVGFFRPLVACCVLAILSRIAKCSSYSANKESLKVTELVIIHETRVTRGIVSQA